MSEWPRFCDLPGHLSDPSTAVTAVLPVPYDRTSTWKKGADKGPMAILEASHHIEWYDVASGSEMCRLGIATLRPVLCNEGPEKLADLVDRRVTDLLQRGTLPVVLGGDHSVSIGAIRAASREIEELTVLQIDAHADTRESYQGSSFNHACVMARAREWCQVVQVGIRAIDADEAAGLDPDRVVWGHQINGPEAQPRWADRALAALSAKLVYRFLSSIFRGYHPSR